VKRFNLKVLVALIILMLIAISCQHEDQESNGPVFVKVKVRLSGRNASMGPNFVTSSGVASAFVSAVPDTFYPFTPSTDLGAGYDEQSMNPPAETVSLTVPLDTPIRIAKVTYSTALTLAEMLSGAAQPSYVGASDVFTISAGTSSKTVEVVMQAVAGGNLMGEGVQGQTLSLSGVVTTFAGSGNYNYADGIGITAEFTDPHDICTDGTYLYVVDKGYGYIRRISLATGAVDTLAGDGTSGFADGTGTGAQFNAPAGITTDGTNLYIADQVNNRIRQVVIATGATTTIAGSAASGTNDGTGSTAEFDWPTGITLVEGDLYVADMNNNLIRKVNIATQVVTTFAGDGSAGFLEGTGTAARFDVPHDITTDGTNLYVADQDNNRIRKIVISTQVVSTLVGDGVAASTDGTGTGAQLNIPEGITTDGTYLYFTDWGVSVAGPPEQSVLRRTEISTGITQFIAGGSATGGNCDGNDTWCYNGTGTDAKFQWAHDLTTDGTYLYLADFYNHRIRRIE